MIKHLYTLKKELADSDIYVWDVGKKAVWVFSYLAFRGVDVRGFVTDCEKFVGDSIMNRPIISPDGLKDCENAVLIVYNDAGRGLLEKTSSFGKSMYLKDALEIDPALKDRSVYIYGTTDGAWEILGLFAENGIRCKGLLLSEKKGPDRIGMVPVFQFDQISFDEDDVIVISAYRDRVAGEITDYIESRGFAGDVYIRELVQFQNMWGTDPFPMLDAAIKDGKRIILCCEGISGRQLLGRIFRLYGVSVYREVCFAGDADRGLDDIWSLSEEDPEKCAVLIHAFSDKTRYETVRALTDMGFLFERHDFAAVQKCFYNSYFPLNILEYERDGRLEYNLDYSPIGGIPGWAVHGKGSEGLRIMVLGGSTSTELYYPESWVSKLYKRLSSEGEQVCIYNGACEANGVCQEFLRLTRDIGFIRPDIVISLSGVNDYGLRSRDRFETLRGESDLSYWRRMESYMKIVAESEGARFIGVLQPMNVCMEPDTLRECMLFTAETRGSNSSFASESRSDDFYIDLLNLFHHREGMFIDNCHYSDEANGIIADIVYKAVKQGR